MTTVERWNGTPHHPKVIEALDFWVNLTKEGVHPKGVVEWGTTPKDFMERKAAIIVTTTGNLTNIRATCGKSWPYFLSAGPHPAPLQVMAQCR